MLGLSHWSQEI